MREVFNKGSLTALHGAPGDLRTQDSDHTKMNFRSRIPRPTPTSDGSARVLLSSLTAPIMAGRYANSNPGNEEGPTNPTWLKMPAGIDISPFGFPARITYPTP